MKPINLKKDKTQMAHRLAKDIARSLKVTEIKGQSILHHGMREAEIAKQADLIEALAEAAGLSLDMIKESIRVNSQG